MNTQKQIFLIVVLFFVFTGACAAYTAIDLPVRAPDQEQWHFDESVERGALLFANNCRTCHGNAGQGGVGPELNREEFRNQDPILLTNNKNMIRRTVTCGRAGTFMPTWGQAAGGPLNAVQVEHIVNFLTAPAEDEENEEGPNFGWIEAVEFAHNLNGEAPAAVGGDTLATIAEAHGVGYQEVADLNGLEPTSAIPSDARIELPPNREFPNGRTVKILSDNSSVEMVTNDFEVGAMLIADLNGLEYEYDADTNQLTLQIDGDDVPGLLPGEELELPDGATYIVRAEDTLDLIAETHGLSASEIRSLNQDVLTGLADDDPIPHERTLELPASPVWNAALGDTIGLIASLHGIEDADVLAANPDVDPEADLVDGQLITLPAGATYVIQAGDTLQSAAIRHNIGEEELAQLNDLEPGSPIGPDVVLALPKVDAYVVQGQTLEEVADGYANGDVDDFAETNEIDDPEAPLRVGTPLVLPEDVWGTAPSLSVNLGEGCTQFTVSESVYDDIIGEEGDSEGPPVPAQQSTDVDIVGNSNDWTVTADGTAMPPNEGVVAVARGTTINFRAAVGVHTITLGGDTEEVVNDDFVAPDTDTVTFNDPGAFQILCDVHPAMLAWVFVQEPGAAGATTTPAAGGTQTPTAGN
ncbi:MAG: LysM peptidoglycan-binding domain-containing protein [Dehalococcoidia bacterium]